MGAALVGLLSSGCKHDHAPAAKVTVVADAAIAPAPVPFTETLAQALALVRERRAVVLDRRIAAALVDLGTITGAPACTVTDHVGRSTIACGTHTLAELSALPDWEPLHAALAHAAELTPALAVGPPLEHATDWLVEGARGGLARARAAGQRWQAGDRSTSVVLDSLHGLIATLYAERDAFGLSDPIAARALALLALAERGAPRPVEDGLLAHVLGYEVAAARIADRLPAGDLVRAYLQKTLATRTQIDPKATTLALVLAHRELVERGDPGRAAHLRARMTSVDPTSVQATRLFSPRYGDPLVLGPLLPSLVLDDARALGGAPPDEALRADAFEDEKSVSAWLAARHVSSRTAVVQQIAEQVSAIESAGLGTFLDGGLVSAHFRSLVAADDDVFRLGAEQKLKLPELEEIEVGSEPAQRPVGYRAGLEWVHYASLLAKHEAPDGSMLEYLRKKDSLFGPEVLTVPIRDYWIHIDWMTPVLVDVAHELRHRLDSRPSGRPLLARIAWQRLDWAHYLEVGKAWQDAVGTHTNELDPTLAICNGNAAAVHARVADAHASPLERHVSYAALERTERLVPADGKNMAALVMSEQPTAADVLRATQLLSASDPRGAEKLALGWIAKHPNEQTSETVALVLTEVARLQQQRKDLRAAQHTIELALGSGGDPAILRAALIELARGDATAALARVDARMLSHPDSNSIGNAVQIDILAKKMDDAARAITHPLVPLSHVALNQELGPKLVDAIRDDATLHAFLDALTRAGFNLHSLLFLSFPFRKAGHHDLAFTIMTAVPAEGFARTVRDARAYTELSAAKGPAAADAWARKDIPAALVYPFGVFAQRAGDVNPLFSSLVVDPVGEDEVADTVWNARVKGLLLARETNGPRWARVVAHYAQAGTARSGSVEGRLMVGLGPVSALDPFIIDRDKLGSAAMDVALVAFGKGHMAEAFDWFQVTLQEDAGGHNDDVFLAHDVADSVGDMYLGLDELAKKGRWPVR